MSEAGTYIAEDSANGRTLHFAGSLKLDTIAPLAARLEQEEGVTCLDLSKAGQVDTVGAWLIHRTAKQHGAKLANVPENIRILIAEVTDNGSDILDPPRKTHGFTTLIEDVGKSTKLAFSSIIGLIAFIGALMRSNFSLLRHPRRFPYHELVQGFEFVGVRALAIIGLMSFLIGIVIAQQGAVQLRQFGAEVFTVNLIGRLTTRELGVLMTAIMVAGRSGSAFAAQIGTMQLTEEVDAMRTIGVSPVEALVFPRVVSTVLMMPLLGFYASIAAMIGGGLLAWLSLDIPPASYVQRIREVVPMTDIYVGLVKAPVFGFIIAVAGCYQGMLVRGNAEEVGFRTTAAVVQAIFMVIVLDAFFAVFFTEIGWT